MDFSSIKKTVGIFVLSMVAVSGFAQDIIARQAPSDKRLKDIRNVKLNNTAAISADLNNPAANIYTDWTDNLRSCTGAVPANYKIDLRGFCMPTPSRKINSNFGPRWGRNGLETLYGHLSKQIVKKDQVVRAGEPIGLGGNTGKSSGSHLHFETRVLGQPIDPALLFDFEHQDVVSDYFVLQNGISKGNSAQSASTISTGSAQGSNRTARR